MVALHGRFTFGNHRCNLSQECSSLSHKLKIIMGIGKLELPANERVM